MPKNVRGDVSKIKSVNFILKAKIFHLPKVELREIRAPNATKENVLKEKENNSTNLISHCLSV